jgi:hypothetical protein
VRAPSSKHAASVCSAASLDTHSDTSSAGMLCSCQAPAQPLSLCHPARPVSLARPW